MQGTFKISKDTQTCKLVSMRRCLDKRAKDANCKIEIKAGIEKPDERLNQFVIEGGISKLARAMWNFELGSMGEVRWEQSIIWKVSRSSEVYEC